MAFHNRNEIIQFATVESLFFKGVRKMCFFLVAMVADTLLIEAYPWKGFREDAV